MNFDLDDIRSQLAPGWSPVNIVLLVVLFVFFRWLGFAMLAYILLGHKIGLNLGEPTTYAPSFNRLKDRVMALLPSNKAGGTGHTGTPSGSSASEDYSRNETMAAEKKQLDEDRRQLERERSDFEKEKRDFLAKRNSSEDTFS